MSECTKKRKRDRKNESETEKTNETEKTKARKQDRSWASAEIFPGGATSTFCLSFSSC